jgi:casein kinase II subunit beta
MSDTLKMSRFKCFCPRCEEVYVPKAKQVNIDGAAFGSSFPHVFLTHYPMVVILPPKIYNYEPKIFGFKIAGKRGSKYFEPSKGNVRIVEDSLQSIELEMIKNKQAAELEQAFDLKVNLEQSQQNSK